MQIKSLIAVAALLATAVAWRIPEDQPDGTYSVERLDNGTYIHTRIGDVPTKVSSYVAPLGKLT